MVSALVCSVLLAALWLLFFASAFAQTVPEYGGRTSKSATITPNAETDGKAGQVISTEERVTRLEEMLLDMTKATKATEGAIYIKMVTYELIAYLRWIVVALISHCVGLSSHHMAHESKTYTRTFRPVR